MVSNVAAGRMDGQSNRPYSSVSALEWISIGVNLPPPFISLTNVFLQKMSGLTFWERYTRTEPSRDGCGDQSTLLASRDGEMFPPEYAPRLLSTSILLLIYPSICSPSSLCSSVSLNSKKVRFKTRRLLRLFICLFRLRITTDPETISGISGQNSPRM